MSKVYTAKILVTISGLTTCLILTACGGSSSSSTTPTNPTTVSNLLKTGFTKCSAGKSYSNLTDCTLTNLGSDWYGLQQDGEVQAGKTMSYTLLTQNYDECVKDNVTGLIWEQKTDDSGIRDKDNNYYWYNPDMATNGGYAGLQKNPINGLGGNTLAYINALNASNYCGYSNWRLPTIDELNTLVNYSEGPYLNPVFKFTDNLGNYWSSTPDPKYNYKAFAITSYGQDYLLEKNMSYSVRAVRSN